MKTKKLLALSAALALVLMLPAPDSYAQMQKEICGTTEHTEYLKSQRPNLDNELRQAEILMQQWMDANADSRDAAGLTDTIPVVVHVIWNTSAENVSNTQVLNTILALNQDHGRTNSDTINTPAVWQPISASTGIQFCMAQRDPSGSPTNGIERRQTSVSSFTTDDLVKSYATGGMDAWDPSRYFNIWICNLVSGLGGYAEFPTSVLSYTYGVAIDYATIGSTGWVISHECGHCFNLRHIWGDDGGACTGSDQVSDTPNQADATSSPCPSFPALDACQTASPGIMFMNYMDYGSASCKNMFTLGQRTRAQAAIHNLAYASLLTSNGCDAVILQPTDAGSPLVISPSGLECSDPITPVVRIRNWGTNPLTSVTINYRLDANPLQTFAWNGSLLSLATADVTLPPLSASAGNHTFKCYTSNPNGGADGNALNDTSTSSFNNILTGQTTPFSYGFEPTTFPPTGWTLDNPDASISWARTTAAAKTGVASMRFNSINYPCNGCIDIITLPNINLTTIASPLLTFQVAYRLLSDPGLNPNWSDSLRVDISTNCGTTWTNLYFKYGTTNPATTLTTIVPSFSTTSFIPAQSNWRLETINLASYAAIDNALFRFKVSSDYENNLYVDDINITGITGISAPASGSSFTVYPNPATNELRIEDSGLRIDAIEIYDVIGERVFQSRILNPESQITLDVSGLTPGIYFIFVRQNQGVTTRKVVIQ
ncbi:MAG TPA: M43 family zinc metalloprotease [Bacteroidia bacterium]|nr:M43 family zinc metalloprotease [Bacteroidia bacterium]